MKTYVNMRPSNKSAANASLHQLGRRLDAESVGRDCGLPVDCDFLIQWGFKPTHTLLEQIKRGKPYAIIDLGYFDAERTNRFSVSINGLHGLAMRDPRVLDRAPRPHPRIEPWRKGDGERVIVAGQLPYDQSLRGQDIEAWMGRTSVQAADVFNKPVIKRPHPKMINPWETLPPPLAVDLKDCHCLVTWTSTAAVGSVLQGVPTVAMHPGSMALPMAATGLEIVRPVGREAWAHELSWREWSWTAEELDRLAEYLTELYPLAVKAPLDTPRRRL